MSVDVLDIRDLTFRYNGVDVLQDLRFSVATGDYVGLVGPNGSGKTTLIRLLLGLLEAGQGEIRLFGRPIGEFRDWRGKDTCPETAFVTHRFHALWEIVPWEAGGEALPKILGTHRQGGVSGPRKVDIADLRNPPGGNSPWGSSSVS